MREHIVLDTSAWIEYIVGSDRGKKVKQALKGRQVTLCAVSVMEFAAYARKKGLDADALVRETLRQIIVFEVSAQLAINAATLYVLKRKKASKFSYNDALAYMTADELQTEFIACDNDFSGMKNTVVVR